MSAHETDPFTGRLSVCEGRKRALSAPGEKLCFLQGTSSKQMKMSDCQCIDSHNEKDSCGQSGVFMSVVLQVTSLQASDKGSQPWPGGGSWAHTRTRVARYIIHNRDAACTDGLSPRQGRGDPFLSPRQRHLKDRCLLFKVWSENTCIPFHGGI